MGNIATLKVSRRSNAQVGFANSLVVQQFLTAARQNDLAGFDDVGPVRDRKRGVRVLRAGRLEA